jgi:hypothetical protein
MTMFVKSINREESKLVLLNRRLARFALLSGHVLSKPHPSPFFPTPFSPTYQLSSSLLTIYTPFFFPEDVRYCIGKKIVFGPYSFSFFGQNSDDFSVPQNFF